MAQNAYPELIAQHSHRPGMEDAKTFEDTLRELLRSSPYLVFSIVVHAILLVLFASANVPPKTDPSKAIKATAEQQQEIIPPPPEEKPPEPEEIEKLIEDPVVSETEVTETEVLTDYELMDSTKGDVDKGSNDIIGVGGGGLAGGGGKFGRRGGGQGAGTPYNKAVDDALEWLKNHQSPDGFWSCAAFDTECGKQGQDTVCDGTGGVLFDTGVTGLALLAFLGHGDTHKDGKFKSTVKGALKYLVDVQSPDGNFGNEANSQYTYDHIICALAMVEAYALTRDNLFKKPATKGLEYMYKIRNPGAAWRYSPRNPEMLTKPNDMSVTGWAIMAMTSAKECGLPVDAVALEDSLLFLEEMTDPITGRTGYYDRGGPPPRMSQQVAATWPNELSESMTAVGVLCRIFGDPDLNRPGNLEMITKGIDLMSALPPLWSDDAPGRRDFYYWYYGTYALYQCNTPEIPKGKAAWKAWEDTLIETIAEHQHREGERKGSWDPQADPWGRDGGRVYSTAILALTMEVFYRYDSVVGAH
ncbi:MAG: terpene cyclase/mutase family protein [Planctomycetes bacterium]|nr:terpene cyclase/mutase family protein [Planctomycetota bacterium]